MKLRCGSGVRGKSRDGKPVGRKACPAVETGGAEICGIAERITDMAAEGRRKER